MPAAEIWRFNAETALFGRVTADGVEHTATYSELSGQDFTLTASGDLVDNSNPFNRYRQGSGDINYVRYSNGFGELTSELAGTPKMLYTTELATYGISGTINLHMPDGSDRSIDIHASDLMGPGRHVYSWTGADGSQEFASFVPGSAEQLSAELAAGPSWREATSDEIITYAVRGYLANNEQELLADYAGPDGQGMTDEARQARYDAARSIAQLASTTGLGFFKSHLVGFGP